MPVNLARSKLLSLPCEEMLYTECCKYVLAQFLILDFKDSRSRNKFFWNSRWERGGEYIIFAKSGYTLLDSAFVQMAGIDFINFLAIGNEGKNERESVIDTENPLVFHDLKTRGVTKLLFESVISEQAFGESFSLRLCFLHLEKNVFKYVSNELQRPKWDYLEVKETEQKFIVSPKNLSQSASISFDIKEFPMVAEFVLKTQNLQKDDIMLNLLQRYLKPNCFIPYELSERKRMFPDAFKELKKYM